MIKTLKAHIDLILFIILTLFLFREIDPMIYAFFSIMIFSYFIFSKIGLWKYLKGLFALTSLALPIFLYGTIKSVEVSAAIMMFLTFLKYTEVHSLRDKLNFYTFVFLFMAISVILSDQLLYLLYLFFIVFHIFKSLIKLKNIEIKAVKYRKILTMSFIFTIITYFIIPQLSLGNIFKFRPKKAMGGYGQGIRPGSFTEIVQNNEVYFIFSPENNLIDTKPYWRGQTYSITDGRTWSSSYSPKTIKEDVYSKDIIGRVKIINTDEFPLVTKYDTVPLNNSFKLNRNKFFEYSKPRVLKNYDLVSQKTHMRHVTSVNLGLPSSIKKSKLYKEVTKLFPPEKSYSPEDKVQIITDYLNQLSLTYSLKTNINEDDSMDKFLFEDKLGYCEHFASAMALALRIAGVHANVIGGFYGGDFNRFANYLVIRGSNAHAWVEYFDGRTWTSIDPVAILTNGESLPLNEITDSFNLEFLNRAQSFDLIIFDYLENLYLSLNSAFFSYDIDAQKELFLFFKVQYRNLIKSLKSLEVGDYVNIMLIILSVLSFFATITYALVPQSLILYLLDRKRSRGGSIESALKGLKLTDVESQEFIRLFNLINYSNKKKLLNFEYLTLKRKMLWKLLKL